MSKRFNPGLRHLIKKDDDEARLELLRHLIERLRAGEPIDDPLASVLIEGLQDEISALLSREGLSVPFEALNEELADTTPDAERPGVGLARALGLMRRGGRNRAALDHEEIRTHVVREYFAAVDRNERPVLATIDLDVADRFNVEPATVRRIRSKGGLTSQKLKEMVKG